ncbi:MAG: methionyl-tRNA formyltransferase [Rhodospirillaceae bacterium]|jgi:methionyl-tRNA formyltransferase|nr:methionyl-tRNA formyltransferase [Rhodospirillaceae bacterium]
MTRLRLAFMGTPEFARASLAALIAAGHDIAAVYSQPPRPAGRGQQPRPSPVQALAEQEGLPVAAPTTLNDPAEQARFAALDLDAAVVAAYGLILPPAILSAPRRGCLNIHASLLPRWRGAAPIQHAILAGDAETGITIMQMDEGLDTGPMLLHRSVPIGPADTGASLHDRLAGVGANLIVDALEKLAGDQLTARPQPAEGAIYAPKLTREDGRLDWRRPAAELARRVRALAPWPGAWCEADGERLKILAAEPVAGSGPPGRLLDDQLTVACGDGALRLLTLQRAGKAPLPAEAFLRGFAIPAGRVLA